jgi:hypothetical protein
LDSGRKNDKKDVKIGKQEPEKSYSHGQPMSNPPCHDVTVKMKKNTEKRKSVLADGHHRESGNPNSRSGSETVPSGSKPVLRLGKKRQLAGRTNS